MGERWSRSGASGGWFGMGDGCPRRQAGSGTDRVIPWELACQRSGRASGLAEQASHAFNEGRWLREVEARQQPRIVRPRMADIPERAGRG
jgi:hypothetical protein